MVSLLVTILILVVIFGLLVYAVQLLPLPPPFKNVAIIIVILILILILLSYLGMLGAPFRPL